MVWCPHGLEGIAGISHPAPLPPPLPPSPLPPPFPICSMHTRANKCNWPVYPSPSHVSLFSPSSLHHHISISLLSFTITCLSLLPFPLPFIIIYLSLFSTFSPSPSHVCLSLSPSPLHHHISISSPLHHHMSLSSLPLLSLFPSPSQDSIVSL